MIKQKMRQIDRKYFNAIVYRSIGKIKKFKKRKKFLIINLRNIFIILK